MLEQLATLSPYIRVAMESTHPATWELPEREIWDYEILYLQEGRLLVTVEDIAYNGIPGDIFVFKPGQRHSIHVLDDRPVSQPHVHFDLHERPDSQELAVSFRKSSQMTPLQRGWFRPNLLSDGPLAIPNHIRLRHPKRFETMLIELIEEFQLKLALYEVSCKGLLLSLLAYLIRHSDPSMALPEGNIQAVRRHLHAKWNSEVTLEELSGMFNISKYYLVRTFKKHYETTPIQYHRQIRIDKAKQLLRYTTISIQHISDQLGFGSIHAFSRAFKMAEGMPPIAYRTASLSLPVQEGR
ncbi:AraC family transcriptional regulator [Paenibacillus rhizovicinus]|uniref:AraC family transcriptional regulator n=1 Tax=Paenibacillus rhizovicinus TaxID=2704463 RepID=A0A6C0NYK7_9BACL|nr:AraC family transcriptional regulator [Paenibacillus rhizovicinus]QHW30793.1 AraC family transcriptional regulator [Paenibacillus rhizovicinus]